MPFQHINTVEILRKSELIKLFWAHFIRIPAYPGSITETSEYAISKRTGEKIYHLPIDQQYDKNLIEEEKNECYIETVNEAEELGFRRAWRWIGNNK